RNLGVAVYSALASGFLTGKYAGDAAVDSPRAGSVAERYLSDPRAKALLADARSLAERHVVPVTQVAIAWLRRPAVTCAIASATTVDQLGELLAALELDLGDEELDGLGAGVPV